MIDDSFGICERVTQLIQTVLILNLVYLFAELLYIINGEIKKYTLYFFYLSFYILFADQYIVGNIFGMCVIRLIRSAVKFSQITVIGCIKIFFDIYKVHDIAILEIMIRAVYPCKGLQQIMSIERATQIQFFQTWCVKASKKHFVDNEDIYLLQLLETFDILLAFLLVTLVM